MVAQAISWLITTLKILTLGGIVGGILLLIGILADYALDPSGGFHGLTMIMSFLAAVVWSFTIATAAGGMGN